VADDDRTMEETMIEEKLRQIVATVAETTPDFPVTADLREDLRVDSVCALEIIFDIERVLKIRLPADRYAGVRTFQDLLGVLESLKG
jgi:acyl carrier protein